jgi:hypothetical protein
LLASRVSGFAEALFVAVFDKLKFVGLSEARQAFLEAEAARANSVATATNENRLSKNLRTPNRGLVCFIFFILFLPKLRADPQLSTEPNHGSIEICAVLVWGSTALEKPTRENQCVDLSSSAGSKPLPSGRIWSPA